jgi:hypothetical protein
LGRDWNGTPVKCGFIFLLVFPGLTKEDTGKLTKIKAVGSG